MTLLNVGERCTTRRSFFYSALAAILPLLLFCVGCFCVDPCCLGASLGLVLREGNWDRGDGVRIPVHQDSGDRSRVRNSTSTTSALVSPIWTVKPAPPAFVRM